MHLSVPTSFLNLDLELKSATSLDAFVQHLAGEVFVLINEKVGGQYFLGLEPIIDGALCSNLENCTRYFIDLLNILPAEMLAVWYNCTSRIFDFGFDGGLESLPLSTMLSTKSLREMAQLGVDMKITIYSFRGAERDLRGNL